jgi:MFS family permease
MAGGQYLLGFADPQGFELFVLISALCSLAVVPIALTRRVAPRHDEAAPIKLAVLAKRIPQPLLGVFVVSLSYGCFYAMGAVYALAIGFKGTQIASFMASAILGSVLMQWPIGLLSDRIDRRRVIVWLCAAVSVIAVLLAIVPGEAPGLIYLLMFLYGGLSFPLYGVFVALAGDSLEADELVSASSKILLANGVGSALGPMGVAWLMENVANAVYGLFIALVHVAVGVLAVRSLLSTPSVVVGQPAHFTPITPQSSVVATEMAGRVSGQP